MAGFFWVLVLLIALVLNIYLAHLAAGITTDKGYDEGTKWFLICLFCGLVGYMLVIALPDLELRARLGKLPSDRTPFYVPTNDAPTTEVSPPVVPISTNISGSWRCKACGCQNQSGSMFCRDCGEYK